MKKIIMTLVSVCALCAFAGEPKEIARIRLTDQNGLIAAVSKIGELSGNPMMGAMLVAQVAKNEIFAFFGPSRAGEPILLPVFLDDGGKPNSAELAILYPIESRAKFLAKHPKAVEKDGFMYVKNDSFDLMEETYFKFSADGKWVAVCDKSAYVAPALASLASGVKPLNGDLVRIDFPAEGVKAIVSALDKARDKKGKSVLDKSSKVFLQGVGSFNMALRVDDKGLTIRGNFMPLAGSELAKVGFKSLAADALAFAGADALCASSSAADSGAGNPGEVCDAVLAVLKKNGLKTDFLQLTRESGSLRATLDVAALIKYIDGENGKAFEKLDPETFVGEVRAAAKEPSFKASGPAVSTSFAIKGFTPKHAAAKRFARTLPEAKEKALFNASVFSIYSVFKAVLPQILKDGDPDAEPMKAMLGALPPEGEGAIAAMQWREGDCIRFLIRVSDEEWRAIGSTFNTVMCLVMSNVAREVDENDFDEDDDDTGDADED